MGCCLGTARPPPPPHSKNVPTRHNFHHSKKPNSLPTRPGTRSPPPVPVAEEESVKEVLSETPISKPPPPPPPQKTPEIPVVKDVESHDITHSVPKEEEDLPNIPKLAEAAVLEEASHEASEPCGVSESYSYSTTTTTITEARDDEATSSWKKREVGPRVDGGSGPGVRRKRPYSSGERDRVQLVGPKQQQRRTTTTTKTETMSFRGRELPRTTLSRSGSGGGAPTGVRRETVSSRSRSPAIRTGGGVGRGGVRGKSPAKVTGRTGGGSSSVRPEESEKKGKKEEVLLPAGTEEEQPNDGVSQQQQQGNETLENPLVSLECFIFV